MLVKMRIRYIEKKYRNLNTEHVNELTTYIVNQFIISKKYIFMK